MAPRDDRQRLGRRRHHRRLRRCARGLGRGSAIAMASINGYKAHPRQVLYTASKHAVIGIVRAAALDLGPRGIRVNALAPGAIATGRAPVPRRGPPSRGRTSAGRRARRARQRNRPPPPRDGRGRGQRRALPRLRRLGGDDGRRLPHRGRARLAQRLPAVCARIAWLATMSASGSAPGASASVMISSTVAPV